MAIKSVQAMIDEARREIDNHSPEEAHRRATEEGALLVDIRDIRELRARRGHRGRHARAPRHARVLGGSKLAVFQTGLC